MSADESALGLSRRWLAERPDFELRSPSAQAAERLPLERPRALVAALGQPDQAYRIVLIAGTKGKGSTAAFISSMLRAHGRRVGLYSQPHLHTFRERLRLDGQSIAADELEAELAAIRPAVEALDAARPDLGPLTAYEITTALALGWFARQAADWAVLEVGLGGRLDATNVVRPDVAVITPISYDHTHILGRTLGAIAAEKAGIVKPGGLVVSAPQRPAALAAIRRVCHAQQARLTLVGSSPAAPRATHIRPLRISAAVSALPRAPMLRFDLECGSERWPDLGINLGGLHQVTNALTAIAALIRAAERGQRFDPNAVRRGLSETRWPGRFELAHGAPLVVIDGAHNGDSAERLREALRLHLEYERLHVVLGVFADKDLPAILRPFQDAAQILAARLEHPRARPAEDVVRAARRLGIEAHAGGSVAKALRAALASASPRDVVCATGSLTTAAQAREALGRVTSDE